MEGTKMKQRNGSPGLLSGLFGCVFGVLGILTIGIVFVPLAALCSAVGFLRGLFSLNLTGTSISVMGGILAVIGVAVSPSLWIVTAGIIAASLPKEATQDIVSENANCTRETAPIRYVVCSDEKLSQWSARMYKDFDEKYNNAQVSRRQKILNDQIAWLNLRRINCDIASLSAVSCLLNETQARALFLEQE